MESVRAPMHFPGGSLLSISDVLGAFPENRFIWVILEFFGIGQAPEGMSMPEFEDRVRSSAGGLRMTWAELKEFGAHVEQTFDCEILAIPAACDSGAFLDGSAAIAKVCALDSTEWYVSVDELADEIRSVLESFRRIAAGA